MIANRLIKSIFLMSLFACAALTTTASDFYEIRNGVQNSQHFWKNDRVGNQYLFFLGNSVIDATGLKNKNLRYSYRMIQGIKKHFPNAKPNEVRQPYPGGSWFSLYRSSRGQPVFGEKICSGHLAVLDFTADDRAVPINEAKLNIEAMLRQVTLYRSTHSTILVFTLTPDMLKAYKAGNIPEYIKVSEQIADHYGIPTLNLAKYAANKIIAGEISFKDFSADGINPTDAGAKIYAEATDKFMDALLTAFPVPDKVTRKKLPKPLFPETNDQGRIVAYENAVVKRRGSWQPGQESPIKPFRHLLVSEKAGDSLTLKFKGSEIGILDVVEKDSGNYEYSIDGAPFKKLPVPQGTQKATMRPVSLANGLDRTAEHTLILKNAGGKIQLGGFLLNGNVEDAYAGMNTLQKIDAIYAAMDPIKYTPPADRFKYIPKAMKTLKEGGEMRMVLLGDSIMGNTTSSSFELLMMRRYPKCKIKKIASLRSSTGCNWYQHENRVEHYVFRHKPDLLLIGGISNGQDAEVVRSVVKQVRAKMPELEIILITPVFGTPTCSHIKNFTKEIDTSKPNFRWGMQKIAAEEKCAFFDITSPWWSYIEDTGKTYGWFMGDAVHANKRGCQIIGRLLDMWFAE
ncbi:MAG: hypothetical protein PF904_09115 [Kiritimatiellae bacterium]|jgi:hypothetical protein|nr:hypothetical protein [Kiritimatiellia bacterium]